MLLHSAAILTVLCYFVLPSRSGLRTLGIKDTLLLLLLLLLLLSEKKTFIWDLRNHSAV